MGVRSPRYQAETRAQQRIGQSPRIGDDLSRVRFEGRFGGLLKRHGLGRDDVHQGTALRAGKYAAVYGFRIGLSTKTHPPTRAPQGLVGAAGDHVRVGDRGGMLPRHDQASDVGYVHHKQGTHFVGDLPEFGEI